MSVRLVLPWLDGDLLDACLDSMSADLAECAYPVDNRGPDATVAGAWNLGRDLVIDGRRDWLVICSTCIRFGAPGGDDLLEALDRSDGGIVSVIGAAWHLVALHRTVLEHVGRFDSFGRAYCEDADYIYRHRLAELGDLWRGEGQRHVHVVHGSLGDAHSIRRGLVDHTVPSRAIAAYGLKWGGAPGAETFDRPFGRWDADWRWLSHDETLARRPRCGSVS